MRPNPQSEDRRPREDRNPNSEIRISSSLRLARRLALSLPLLQSPALLAATNELSPVQLESPSVVFSLFRVAGALALVFALFLGGLWLFRNWQRLVVQRGRAPKLNVLEVKSLGPRHALYVVGYERQRFLLSSAPTGISLLTALPEATETETEAPAQAPLSFSDALAKVLAAKPGKTGGAL